ncbi:MAG: PASTA domain-containing protein [Oscillospiraceae bacterium]|nr:PASTA domain-containing protein [Oscillospiraceae bacterium]
MNQHDLLKAIGEVSEDAVQKYALLKSKNSDAAPDDDDKEFVMEKNKSHRIYFSRAGIAAAAALVLGLNTAFIYAVHRMKQDTVMTPGASIEQEIEVQTTSASEETDTNDHCVLLPDVTNWEFETAKSTLLGLGLYVDQRTSYSDTVRAGRVISIHPEAPAEVKPNSYVRVTVSLGPPPSADTDPDLAGMTSDEISVKHTEPDLLT